MYRMYFLKILYGEIHPLKREDCPFIMKLHHEVFSYSHCR